jgi:antitoxin VapB
MKTAKLFVNGRSQAVRLPKEYQFEGSEVFVQKVGNAVILVPHEKAWEVFLHGLHGFSEDYLSEGRIQRPRSEREQL